MSILLVHIAARIARMTLLVTVIPKQKWDTCSNFSYPDNFLSAQSDLAASLQDVQFLSWLYYACYCVLSIVVSTLVPLSRHMHGTNTTRWDVQEINVVAGAKEARDYLLTLNDNSVQMRTPASEKPGKQSPTPTAGGSAGTSASGMIIDSKPMVNLKLLL